jgi:hypothetical protein
LGQIPTVRIRDDSVGAMEFEARVVYISRRRTYLIRKTAGDKRLPPTRVLTPAIRADAPDHELAQILLSLSPFRPREIIVHLF